ncbi:MAG: hypothetical protein R3B09_20370 [Nannocystaceae bacterium]
MRPDTLTLADHLRREWRITPRRGPTIMALVGVLSVAFTHLVLPLFPERAILFMQRGFRLEDLAGVLVLNDLMAIYFPTFFVGLAGSLGVVLMSREEHRLEILLAKPVRAADLIAARALPMLAMTAGVGVATSLAAAIAMTLHAGIGESVTAIGTLGAGLFLTALAVVLLAALQILFVRLRDPFTGILLGSAVWFMTSIPTAALLYRPDAFAGREALTDLVVVPSLLWHEAAAVWLGPLALLVAAPLAVLLTRVAGRTLERGDAL